MIQKNFVLVLVFYFLKSLAGQAPIGKEKFRGDDLITSSQSSKLQLIGW